MKLRRATLLSLCIALSVAAVVVFWLWSDYVQQQNTLERLLIVRGRAVLSALEGGIRSHRRMGMWLRGNIDAILEETVSAPGILGLAIIDKEGDRIAHGGTIPDTVTLSPDPQWTSAGLVLCRETLFVGFQDDASMMGRQMRGRGRRNETAESPPREPAWFMVLLDDSEYRESLAGARRRFAGSLAITLAAILLGVALLAVVQRHGRLAAELDLARERQKRFEEMSLLGAGLAHETKNPLSVIRGVAQSWLDRSEVPSETRSEAQRIIDESDRVVGRINSFLTYARPQSPKVVPIELGKVISETVALFRDEATLKDVSVHVKTEAVRAAADPDMVRQVVVNLMTNALAACAKGDSITVELVPVGKDTLAISVKDTGEGMNHEDLQRVTKPYFTRREGGTGLGLAIVEQIVEAHKWRLEIDSSPGEGTTVRITDIEETDSQ
jgi:signal transduction histidine kinase